MRLSVPALCLIIFTSPAFGQDDWQRIACIDDPRITVNLLLKPVASAADEEFVGFELHNRTDRPIKLDAVNYRLEVKLSPLDGDGAGRSTGMGSGNPYDLLWRDVRLPEDGPHDNSIPPGVTRRVKYCSINALALLGIPGEGWSVDGRVHFSAIKIEDQFLQTPDAGIPFHFKWMPPDPAGIEAMRRRLQLVLATPADPFGDALLLKTFLNSSGIASAVTVEELLAGLKRHTQVERSAIREYLDRDFASDERVIAFVLEVIHSRDRLLLMELSQAANVHDARLIEPLMEWIREDSLPFHASHFAMRILQRQVDLMANRSATTAELGRIVLSRSPLISKGEVPPDHPWRWTAEMETFVLAGDPSLIRYLAPYLDQSGIVIDAREIALMNNRVSTRACDAAYNGILDLQGSSAERFSMFIDIGNRTAEEEYARRDALIAQKKSDLNKTP